MLARGQIAALCCAGALLLEGCGYCGKTFCGDVIEGTAACRDWVQTVDSLPCAAGTYASFAEVYCSDEMITILNDNGCLPAQIEYWHRCRPACAGGEVDWSSCAGPSC